MNIANLVKREIDSCDFLVVYRNFQGSLGCLSNIMPKTCQQWSRIIMTILPFYHDNVTDSFNESSLVEGFDQQIDSFGENISHFLCFFRYYY